MSAAAVDSRAHGRHGAVKPLRVRLAYAALAFLVAAVAVLGSWALVSARDSQRSRILVSETSTARLAASALSSALEGDLALITNLARQSQLSGLFPATPNPRIEAIGSTLHLLYPQFAGFSVVNAAGLLESVWPPGAGTVGSNMSKTSYVSTVVSTGKAHVSGRVQSGTGKSASFDVVLATPVLGSKGKVLGLIAASLTPADVRAALGGDAFGDGGALVVLAPHGVALTGPAATSSATFLAEGFVSAGLHGETGSGTGPVPGFSGTRLVGYAPVPQLGWAVLAEEPIDVLNGPLGSLTGRLLAIGVLVVLVAAGTALVVLNLVRRLGREREHAGAMVRSVGEGVATIDPAGRVVDVNPALEVLSGRSAADCVGRGCAEVLPLFDNRGQPVRFEDSLIAQALKERRVFSTTGYHLYLGASDGRRVPIALTAGPVLTGTELEGAVVVLRDVSHEREVDQLKTSLVSTVSHELRTPLTMIQGFSELLLTADHLDSSQQQEAVQQIHSSARRLGRLIDDLLSVSRIESGRLTADLEPVDLRDLLDEAVRTFPEVRSERLTVDVAPSLPPVLADRDKTLQVVTNLLSNAVKYSGPEAAIRVTARPAGDHAEIAVSDEGIGMSDDDLRLVFDKFMRADNPAVRKAGGTGLGLYITKSLVELQHGQLWVESRPDEGSTFTFSLSWAGPGGSTAGNGTSAAAGTGVPREPHVDAAAGAGDRTAHEAQGVA